MGAKEMNKVPFKVVTAATGRPYCKFKNGMLRSIAARKDPKRPRMMSTLSTESLPPMATIKQLKEACKSEDVKGSRVAPKLPNVGGKSPFLNKKPKPKAGWAGKGAKLGKFGGPTGEH